MERVLVVPRAAFFAGAWPQGYIALEPDVATRLAAEMATRGEFADRAAAEVDPTRKQPIPYCVVVRGDEMLVVRRRKQGTEGRLHGLFSIGLGGHVGPEDGDEGDPKLLARCLLRELQEEVEGLGAHLDRARPIGLLNDDSNPVGQVHVGLVHLLEIPEGGGDAETDRIRIREISKLEGGLRPLVEVQDLWQDPDRFETWSQLVLGALLDPPSEGGIHPTSTLSDQGNDREEQHGR